MVLILADGFDLYADRDDIGKAGWYSIESNVSFSTTNGRFGGGCLAINSANSWRCSVGIPIGSTVIACFAYYFNNLSGAGTTFRAVVGGNTQNTSRLFSIDTNNAGTMRVFGNPGPAIGSDVSNAFSDQTWHWVEVKVTLGTTNSNGAIEVKIDGTVRYSATGIDTFNSSSDILDALFFTGRAGGGVRLDDLIVMDSSGSSMNDYLGDTRIDTLIPNSNGAATDWTASSGSQYQCVDDVLSGSNDNTDYVYTDDAGELDLQMSNIVGNPATIHAVQTRVRATKTDVGTRLFRTNLLSGSSIGNGPTTGIGIGYGWMRNGIFQNDPDGDIPWTKAAVDALQVQLETLS